MSRIEPIAPDGALRIGAVRVGLRWQDALFVLGVAVAAVAGSVGMTLWQIGPVPSALQTAVTIPLIVSVPIALYLAVQQRRIKTLNQQMQDLLRRDALTGLLTRRAFLDAARNCPGGHLLLIDADRFKAVNDTHGHLAGDAVLSDIAARMGHQAGPDAILGRLGGEEFALLLPGADAAGARDVAEQVRCAVRARPVMFEGQPIRCTISLGLAPLMAGDQAVRRAMAAADLALYRAKSEGRDRCCVGQKDTGGAVDPAPHFGQSAVA